MVWHIISGGFSILFTENILGFTEYFSMFLDFNIGSKEEESNEYLSYW